MADVKIIGKCSVKPAGEPWTGTMKLGDWDQMVTAVYVPTIYFYRPNEEWAGSGRSFVDTLKDSLAQALFHFYPMAGRVHRGPDGSQELHCLGQGAEVTEAESSSELADFGDFSCFSKFQHLIPLVDAMRKPIEELPLVSAQLTHFRCGGLSLGLVTNHGIADGLGAYHFINEWARLARGEALQTAPVHDRSLLRAGEPPTGAGFSAANGLQAAVAPPPPGPPMMPPMKETSMFMLPLSKAQIDKLRSAANATAADGPTKDSTSCRPFSRYEVLTAHIWRSMCKAKGSEGEEPKSLAITLDARPRVSPPLPTSYFGNAVLMVAATSPAGDLITKPLGYACGRIRETIAKVTHEYIQADIDHIKSLKNVVVWQGIRNPVDLSSAMPELGVISWLTLPLHGINFGWGDHIHVSPGPTVMDGVSNLLPGKARDGSAVVIICVQVEYVEKFKNYFYQDLL